MLSQMGHSDAEIAHILHGHHLPDIDAVNEEKAKTEQAKRQGELSLQDMEMQIKQKDHALKSGHHEKLNNAELEHKISLMKLEQEHKKRMLELEYEKERRKLESEDDVEHKKKLREIEQEKAKKDMPASKLDDSEHQKRMLDLEYERAKKEMDLDLQIKQHQAALKAQQMELDAKSKAKEKEADAKVRLEEKKQNKDLEIDSKKKQLKKSEDLETYHEDFEPLENSEFYEDLDLFLPDELNKIDKEQLKKIMGDSENDAKAIDWVRGNLKREDLQRWFARSYQKDPTIFNEDNKHTLLHFMSMNNLHEVANLRLNDDHDFNSGLDAFRQAEQTGIRRMQEKNKDMVPASGRKILDVGNGYGWYSLDKPHCSIEGQAMGHCGNTAASREGDNILSLRKENKIGNMTFHQPAATFIENGGYLGEMKGKQNDKPSQKYHEAISKLLTAENLGIPAGQIKGLIGGGYKPEANFSLSDLPEDKQRQIKEVKPDIEPFKTNKELSKKEIPSKFHNDVEKHNDRVVFNNSDDDNKLKRLISMVNSRDYDRVNFANEFIKSNFFSKDMHNKLKSINNKKANNLLAKSPHLSDEEINDLISDKSRKVGSNAISSILRTREVSNSVISNMLDKATPSIYWELLKAAKQQGVIPTADQVDTLIYNGKKTGGMRVADHFPNLINQDHVDHILKVGGRNAAYSVARSDLPYELKKDLHNSEDRSVNAALGFSKTTPKEKLDELSKSPHSWVRHAVAHNPNASSEAHLTLANDRSKYVLGAIAANSPHPDAIHRATVKRMNMKKDSDADRYWKIFRTANNSNSSADTLNYLADVMNKKGMPNFDEWLSSKDGWQHDDFRFTRHRVESLEPNEQLNHKKAIYNNNANITRERDKHIVDIIAAHPNFNQDAADKIRDIYKDHYEQEGQEGLIHPTVQSMARFPAKLKKEVA